MEFPQGKSNKQHTFIVILPENLTARPYFNLNVVDRVNTFVQTAAFLGVHSVLSSVIFRREYVRGLSLVERESFFLRK
jgi:hypothetical protein